MSVHILPQGDTYPHTLTTECECGPTPNQYGYLIHQAYDGRESSPHNGEGKLKWTFEITDTNER